jgi:hypothetical protein
MASTITTCIPMLVQVNPLPRSQSEPPVTDGNIETRAHETRFDVPRHVIVAFHGMSKGAVAIPLGGHQLVQGGFEIDTHVRIGVFIDGQTRRCVLNEQVAHAHLHFGYVGTDCFHNFIGHQVTTARGSGDGNLVLEPDGRRHGGGSIT